MRTQRQPEAPTQAIAFSLTIQEVKLINQFRVMPSDGHRLELVNTLQQLIGGGFRRSALYSNPQRGGDYA